MRDKCTYSVVGTQRVEGIGPAHKQAPLSTQQHLHEVTTLVLNRRREANTWVTSQMAKNKKQQQWVYFSENDDSNCCVKWGFSVAWCVKLTLSIIFIQSERSLQRLLVSAWYSQTYTKQIYWLTDDNPTPARGNFKSATDFFYHKALNCIKTHLMATETTALLVYSLKPCTNQPHTCRCLISSMVLHRRIIRIVGVWRGFEESHLKLQRYYMSYTEYYVHM